MFEFLSNNVQVTSYSCSPSALLELFHGRGAAGNVTGLSFQLVALSQVAADGNADNGSSFSTEDLCLPISTSSRFIYGVGISLGNKRLDIDQHVFAAGHGCSINPAETITAIAEPAYLAVEHALVAHMKDLGSNRVKGPLCFDRINRSVRARLPSMVFHFEDGAELWFTAEQLFEVRGSLTACFLVVGGGHHRTVIGAAQQVNTRRVHLRHRCR